MFDIRRDKLGETLNDSGWHAAHILEIKNGDTTWRNWDRDELVRRFIRNVHSCNLLLLPKSDWQRFGRQSGLLAFAVNHYRERYGSVLEEARALMSATAPESGGVLTIRYEAAATAGRCRVTRMQCWAHDSGLDQVPGPRGDVAPAVTRSPSPLVEDLDSPVPGLSLFSPGPAPGD
jgi:hypothetical protein